MQQLWVEKYRPKTLDEYVFPTEHLRDKFQEFLNSKTIPNLLLVGHAGTGKSSLIRIILNQLVTEPSYDLLVKNASKDRGIGTIRDEIDSFVSTSPYGSFKVVMLEEANRLTAEAQDSLKAMLEDVSDYVRFVFLANSSSSLSVPLKSRLQEFVFDTHHVDDMTMMMAKMLQSEKVKFNLDVLDSFVAAAYPDNRKLINLLQQHTVGGILQPLSTQHGMGSDWIKNVMAHLSKREWDACRAIIRNSVAPNEWEQLYIQLYSHLHLLPASSNRDEQVLAVAEYLHRSKSFSLADQEINSTALLIKLTQTI